VLAPRNITRVRARALAVGVFRDVPPGGAAGAIDRALDGALRAIWRRRLFTGRAGEIFVLPCAGRGLRAEMIVLAGLGAFDRYGAGAQQLAAENVARTLVAGGVDELATVVWGGGSGTRAAAGLRDLLVGLGRGLRDADPAGRFRRVIVCETNAARLRGMRAALPRLAKTGLLAHARVSESAAVTPAPPAAVDPIYLLVSADAAGAKIVRVRGALLSAGGKAAVVSGTREIARDAWAALVGRTQSDALSEAALRTLGDEIGRQLLAEEVCGVMARFPERHLVVVHDTVGSQVPWEALRVAGASRVFVPALGGGLTRRFVAENLSVAKFLEERRLGETLDLLLVVNPTLDLPGAETEGERVERLFGEATAAGARRVRLVKLHGEEATRAAVRERLRSGEFDVVHYAGHAFFDPADPGRSGLLCAGREVLAGADLADLSSLPALVFFNACESGRVRRATAATLRQRVRASAGVAEAFLRGGLANYLGTYWPVGDTAAVAFAETFYTRLLAGAALGEAVLAGRKSVKGVGSVDWADYVFYGCAEFALKLVGCAP
jgi:hypothetical protein